MAADDEDADLWHFDKERLAGRGGVDVDDDGSLARLRRVVEVYGPEAERRQAYRGLSIREKWAYWRKMLWPISAGIGIMWPYLQQPVMTAVQHVGRWLFGSAGQ